MVDNTGIQGRWQVLNDAPKIIADVAHNKEGLRFTIPQIESHYYARLHLVLGFVKDKAVDEILQLFPHDAHYYLAAPQIPRAMPIEDLKHIAQNLDIHHQIFPTVEAAFFAAKKQADVMDFIYVGGSTFVVGEIL